MHHYWPKANKQKTRKNSLWLHFFQTLMKTKAFLATLCLLLISVSKSIEYWLTLIYVLQLHINLILFSSFWFIHLSINSQKLWTSVHQERFKDARRCSTAKDMLLLDLVLSRLWVSGIAECMAKKNCCSVQNELLTGHFPCGVVERMIWFFFPHGKCHLPSWAFLITRKPRNCPSYSQQFYQYIAVTDIFMSVIWFKEPLKFCTVVPSSEGTFVPSAEHMYISIGFCSLVFYMCIRR